MNTLIPVLAHLNFCSWGLRRVVLLLLLFLSFILSLISQAKANTINLSLFRRPGQPMGKHKERDRESSLKSAFSTTQHFKKDKLSSPEAGETTGSATEHSLSILQLICPLYP